MTFQWGKQAVNRIIKKCLYIYSRILNILGFVGHVVSVTTVQSAFIAQKQPQRRYIMNGHDCVPKNL